MAKYYEVDRDAVRKKKGELGSGKFWNPKDGKNQIRILPPYNDSGVWFFELALHYGIKDEEGRDRAYPCMRQWKGEKCPVCDAISQLKKIDGGAKIAERMNARTKYYANIVDRTVGEDKVFIYGFSAKILNEVLSYDEDEDYGNVVDPKEGYDFVIEKTGQGLQTRYSVRIKPKPSKLGDVGELYDLDEEVPNEITGSELAALVNKTLEDVLESELKESLYGGAVKKGKKTKDEEDEEEDEPKPKAKKKPRVEDEEEEDEPVKKPAKKRAPVEDEDEDEEPPVKKKPRK